MTKILITGMSGTGKSTVIDILAGRGYPTIETDDPGWCVPGDGDWSSPDREWIWDEDRISQLLDDHADQHLFVTRCRANQGRFYHRFDDVVVLRAPINVMLDRVRNRTPNPFGRQPDERDMITKDTGEIEPLLLQSAGLVIDTSTMQPEVIADQLESLL